MLLVLGQINAIGFQSNHIYWFSVKSTLLVLGQINVIGSRSNQRYWLNRCKGIQFNKNSIIHLSHFLLFLFHIGLKGP